MQFTFSSCYVRVRVASARLDNVGASYSAVLKLTCTRTITVNSPEIARASLHIAIPWYYHLYTVPFLSLYPLLAYAYYVKYDQWFGSEEWTFLACVSLGVGHGLSFLVTRWSTGARAWITTRKVDKVSDFTLVSLTHITGSITSGGGLHSYRARCAPWTGRYHSLAQERPVGRVHVHIQLSARHIHCFLDFPAYLYSPSIPLVC